MPTLRHILVLSLVGMSVLAAWIWYHADRPNFAGCISYRPVSNPLIAHGGGGLPDRSYANNRAAIDRSAANGFELIELDFFMRDGRLLIGHDPSRISDMTVDELFEWLEDHPEVRIVTDIKTTNLVGLKQIGESAPELRNRFIPQIFQPDQFEPVRALGFKDIIFADRIGESSGWEAWVNDAPLFAITLPKSRIGEEELYSHPVYFYTVNEPADTDAGFYTDCLIPAPKS